MPQETTVQDQAYMKLGRLIHRCPPVDRDEVYKEIFEQAENLKKYQGAT